MIGLNDIGRRLSLAGRAAAHGVLGSIFLLVGIAFLSAALWLWLAVTLNVIAAHLILGGSFFVIAGLTFALAPSPEKKHASRKEGDAKSEALPVAELAQGFAAGMQAGRAARR